jgi:hypothetical protein
MNQNSGLPEIDDVDNSDAVIDDDSEEFLENKVKPMPNGLKYGLAILPIALIAGLFAMNSMKKAGDEMQIGIDGETIQINQNDFNQASTHVVTDPSSSNKPEEVKEIGAKGKGVGKLTLTATPLQIMQEQVASLSSQMQEMNGVIDKLEKQGLVVGQLRTQVSGIKEQLKHVPTRDELEQVKSNFTLQLEAKAEELKTSLAQLYKKAKRVVSPYKKKPVVMPFRLVSIDQWDGVNYAAIQSNSVGGIENLRQGDARSGWIVSKIDSMRMSVTFEHTKTGKVVVRNTI